MENATLGLAAWKAVVSSFQKVLKPGSSMCQVVNSSVTGAARTVRASGARAAPASAERRDSFIASSRLVSPRRIALAQQRLEVRENVGKIRHRVLVQRLAAALPDRGTADDAAPAQHLLVDGG